MSSHHEWTAEVVAQHDAETPFAPENGQPLAFKVGDRVIYTNDSGLKFPQMVVGYYEPTGPCSLYAVGYRYYLDWSSPWMPVREASLELASS